jgi:hypothetical protein
MTLRILAAACLCAQFLPLTPAFADTPADTGHWVSAWSTALQAIPQQANLPPLYRAPEVGGRTVRQLIYPRLDGKRVRLRLSNVYGTTPLVIDAAHIARAVSGSGAATRPGTDRAVTFAGN